MPISAAVRRVVRQRAGNRCEYCGLSQDELPLVTFHVEHVISRQHDGSDDESNLCLACHWCNLTKAERTVGEDQSGRTKPLFNPRDFEPWLLGWYLHFTLDRESGVIVPRTPTGEATVRSLKMNNALRVFARKLQILAGLLA